MITLYRRNESKLADEVQETLEDLVLAHEIVDVDREGATDITADGTLPVVVESGRAYSGDEIFSLLNELRTELAYERQVSADACYVDPNNPGQCI